MKVLVTGAQGQLGSALCATPPQDWTVTGLVRRQLDIADPSALRAVIAAAAPDLVVNAAAYTAVDRAESESEAAAQCNHRAVADLAGLCAERSIRLVHMSTDFVFDGAQGRPYRPGDATGPLNVYGRTKLAGEQAALAGGRNLVVRTGWVYAASGRNFVRTMLSLMAQGQAIKVVADQVGTPTHARSLARAIWALAQSQASGIYHFSDAGVASGTTSRWRSRRRR